MNCFSAEKIASAQGSSVAISENSSTQPPDFSAKTRVDEIMTAPRNALLMSPADRARAG